MRLGIKAALLQRGLSQREVCRITGIPENKMSSIVNGWAQPSEAERSRIAAVLRQPERVLFGDDTSIEIRSTR